VLFILAGMIKLTKGAASGREIVLEIRVPGDVVGELGAIDHRPRAANAVAISAVEALVIASEPFRRIVADRVGVANAVLVTVVHRLRRASERQLELGTTDPLGRVCARLVELAAGHGVEGHDGTRIDVGITQHDLADWCGISRDGVIRVLRDLRARGLIETSRRSIVVRDVDELRQQGSLAD
jgi:CRP-like cAMP-binding protein